MYKLKYYRMDKNELQYIKNNIENFISNILQSRQDVYKNYRTDINIKFNENTHLLIYFEFTLYYKSIEERINQKENKEKIKEYIKHIFKEFNYKYMSSEIINHDKYEESILIFTKECSFNEFLRINDIINMFKNRIFDINIIYLLNDFILEKQLNNNVITRISFSRYYKDYNFDKSNVYGIRLIFTEFLPKKKKWCEYIFKFTYDLNKNNEVSININYENKKNSIELSIISNKDANKYVDYMKVIYKDKNNHTNKNNHITENSLTIEDKSFIHNVRKEIEIYMFNNLINFLQGSKKMRYLITKKYVIKDIINTIKVYDMLI